MTTNTRIIHIAWGKMEVNTNGESQVFRDCKVWPGGAKEWDWSLTNTHHNPGIQIADIEEIISQDIETMILSRGMQLQLHTTTEAQEYLQQKGIQFHIEETTKGVALFNQYMNTGKRVGGIFHSTC